MQIDSFKLKGFSCFKDSWAGLDEFKPITVIIGRNNSGKSHLLDIVKLLTEKPVKWNDYRVAASGELDEQSLQSAFPKSRHSRDLGGFDDWGSHGSHMVEAVVSWEREGDSVDGWEIPEAIRHQHPGVQAVREERLNQIAVNATSPLSGKQFRRLLADRDITPEMATTDRVVLPDGAGATNLIRRQLNSAELDENLVRADLVQALSTIFHADGEFNRIEVKHHDSESEGADVWEVYLGELGKKLIPLSRSGSGLKTILLTLLNLLTIPSIDGKPASDYVFAFEELENNLHPAVLRRLFSYLAKYVLDNGSHLFLTTHSSTALDFFGTLPEAQLIRVWHDRKSAHTQTLETHFDRVGLLGELGAKPSDILQANGVIWVEGPSDRIYVNRFIELFSGGELREGREYQCAYYGGALLSKIAFGEPDEAAHELANLLRLSNNVAVVCDGDRTAATGEGSRIKRRVQRIKQQIDDIDGADIWITEAKEIENYIPGEVWGVVCDKKDVPDPTKFDRFPTKAVGNEDYIYRELGRRSFDKCEFASAASPLLSKEMLDNRFDWSESIARIVQHIRAWND